MKHSTIILIGILMLVLATTNSIAMDSTSKKVTGKVIKVERYTLYNQYFSYDTLDCFKMNYHKSGKVELAYGESKFDSNKGIVCKICDGGYSIKMSDEKLVVDSISNSTYYIADKPYRIIMLNAYSKTDGELKFLFYVLEDYGILLLESRLWDNHLRMLPDSMPEVLRLNLLCDLILTRKEFKKYRKEKM